MTLDDFLSKLKHVKKVGEGYSAQCPAHPDKSKHSLSVKAGEGEKILINCFAGCPPERVMTALNLQMKDLFRGNTSPGTRLVAEYVYRDAQRKPALKVLRYEPKTFKQQVWTGSEWSWKGEKPKLLYNLPQILAHPDKEVFLLEGEKDADRLSSWGLLATTNPGGAGKWCDAYTETLRGHPVNSLPDNDEPGRRHVLKVAPELLKVGCELRILELPELSPKGDVSKWIDAGHTRSQLEALVEETRLLDEEKLDALKGQWGLDAVAEPLDNHGRDPQNPWEAARSAPEFLQVEENPQVWLRKPLLAQGCITHLYSPRGIGKTLIAEALAVEIAIQGKRVLLLDRDNPAWLVRQRLRGLGADRAETLRVMTRNEVPPLTKTAAWASFPYHQYDFVIIDSLDASTEGVGEQDSSKPSKAIAPILDIAHRDDGPAFMIPGNTVKSGQHGRGSGVVEDRADIVYEVRDATGLKPSGPKDWWLQLPSAGASDWGTRASRRKRRKLYRLAFVPSKFRVDEEPEPFILEIDFRTEPWTLRDVTAEVLCEGEMALAQEKQEQEEKKQAVIQALIEKIEARDNENDPLLSEKEAVPFLQKQGLTRKDARQLIKDQTGRAWCRRKLEGRRGQPMALLPTATDSPPISKEVAEINQVEENSALAGVSETPISATRINTGRRKSGELEPAPDGDSSQPSLFPPEDSKTGPEQRLEAISEEATPGENVDSSGVEQLKNGDREVFDI